MDSVTQFALGATIGTAVFGKHIGIRRAAITGGLLATLPDLDVYLPADDPVQSFVGHRGASHSLFVHALIAPVLGEGLYRLFKELRTSRVQVYLAVFTCLATHALLDAMTIYGTRLFWPFWPEAVGLGSIFIIDPLYTLPLLIITLWAFGKRNWDAQFGKAAGIALVLSTVYLGWSATGQLFAEDRGRTYLADRDVSVDRLIATPTPLNTLFWRVIAVSEGEYFHIYVPLVGGGDDVTAFRHVRWTEDLSCWIKRAVGDDGPTKKLVRFTDGFFQVTQNGGNILVSDLRMGLFPDYVFQFSVAERKASSVMDTKPERIRGERSQPGDWEWLMAGLRGHGKIRPAEANRLFNLSAGQLADRGSTASAC